MTGITASTKPIRVLFATETGNYFGSEAAMLNVIRAAKRQAIEPVAMVGWSGELVDRLRELGVPVHVVPHRPKAGLRTVGDIIRVNWRVLRLIQAERIDVVDANTTAVLPFVMYAARLARRPVVARVKTTMWLSQHDRLMLRCADRILYETAAVRSTLMRPRRSDVLTAIPRHKLVWSPPTRHLCDWRAAHGGRSFRDELGLTATQPVIGLVAALHANKRQHVLVRALPRILQEFPDAKVVLVGAPYAAPSGRAVRQWPGVVSPYVEELKRLVADLGLGSSVIFAGFRSDVARIIQSFTVATLLSQREAAGSVLIEYMACGKPVVATAAEGIPETLNGAGRLVPVDDVEATAQAILGLLRDPDAAKRLAEAGRAQAAKRFSAEERAVESKLLYEELCSGNRAIHVRGSYTETVRDVIEMGSS